MNSVSVKNTRENLLSAGVYANDNEELKIISQALAFKLITKDIGLNLLDLVQKTFNKGWKSDEIKLTKVSARKAKNLLFNVDRNNNRKKALNAIIEDKSGINQLLAEECIAKLRSSSGAAVI